MRDSFILYTEIKEVVDALTNEQKGILFQAILDYEANIEPQIEDSVVKVAFIPIKQSLDRNNEKWEKERSSRSEAGKKGMQKRWSKDADSITDNNTVITNDNKNNSVIEKDNSEYQDVTNITVNVPVPVPVNEPVNVPVNVNEPVPVNKKESGDKPHRFTPPTLDEVKDYCWERNNGIDAQAFIDFYTSKGWMVGKNKMKDWKACVRTWEKRNRGQPKEPSGFFKVDDDFFRRKLEGL